LVYLQTFHRNSLSKCALQPEIAKNLLKPLLRVQNRSRLSMLISQKKPVINACYYKQHVCTYMQPFSHYTNH